MEEYSDRSPADIARYPMVPIRDVVIFPFTKVAFKIGRPGSVRALEMALASDRTIFLSTQHDATVDEPSPEQIYSVGTIARILQSQRQENGQIKVVVEGRERATTVRVENNNGAFTALVRRAPAVNEEGVRTDALVQKIAQLVEQHLRLAPDVQPDALQTAMRNADPSHMADALASQLRISVEDKQGLLELFSAQARLARLIEILEIELEKRQLDRTIQTRVKRQMEKAQKEYYLNEQIKAIHKELGRKDERAELDELKKKIEEAGMTEEAKEKALQELHRLEAMPPMSAEGTVSRTYITFLQCPFQYFTQRLMRLKTAPLRPEERLSFLEQGNIVHEVLAEWWKQPRDVAPLFEQIFARHLEAAHIPNGYHTERLRNAMLDDLKRFTSLDAWPRGAFQSQTEIEFAFPLAEGLEIAGRIDRLDVAPDGRAFVLDYKYSAAQRVKDKLKNENLMQAPLYMMAAEHLNVRPAGMFYVGVKGGIEYAGWSDDPLMDSLALPEKWLETARERTLRIVEEIRRGRVEIVPADRDSCRFCDAKDVCRIEVAAAAGEAEGA